MDVYRIVEELQGNMTNSGISGSRAYKGLKSLYKHSDGYYYWCVGDYNVAPNAGFKFYKSNVNPYDEDATLLGTLTIAAIDLVGGDTFNFPMSICYNGTHIYVVCGWFDSSTTSQMVYLVRSDNWSAAFANATLANRKCDIADVFSDGGTVKVFIPNYPHADDSKKKQALYDATLAALSTDATECNNIGFGWYSSGYYYYPYQIAASASNWLIRSFKTTAAYTVTAHDDTGYVGNGMYWYSYYFEKNGNAYFLPYNCIYAKYKNEGEWRYVASAGTYVGFAIGWQAEHVPRYIYLQEQMFLILEGGAIEKVYETTASQWLTGWDDCAFDYNSIKLYRFSHTAIEILTAEAETGYEVDQVCRIVDSKNSWKFDRYYHLQKADGSTYFHGKVASYKNRMNIELKNPADAERHTKITGTYGPATLAEILTEIIENDFNYITAGTIDAGGSDYTFTFDQQEFAEICKEFDRISGKFTLLDEDNQLHFTEPTDSTETFDNSNAALDSQDIDYNKPDEVWVSNGRGIIGKALDNVGVNRLRYLAPNLNTLAECEAMAAQILDTTQAEHITLRISVFTNTWLDLTEYCTVDYEDEEDIVSDEYYIRKRIDKIIEMEYVLENIIVFKQSDRFSAVENTVEKIGMNTAGIQGTAAGIDQASIGDGVGTDFKKSKTGLYGKVLAEWALTAGKTAASTWEVVDEDGHDDALHMLSYADSRYEIAMAPAGTIYFAFWMKSVSTTRYVSCALVNAAATAYIGIEIDTTMDINVYDGDSAQNDTGFNLAADTWYHFLIEYIAGTSCKVWMNKSLIHYGAGHNMTPSRLMITAFGVGGTPATGYWDAIYVGNSAADAWATYLSSPLKTLTEQDGVATPNGIASLIHFIHHKTSISMTTNASWTNVDLTSLIPPTAKTVILLIQLTPSAAAGYIHLRANANQPYPDPFYRVGATATTTTIMIVQCPNGIFQYYRSQISDHPTYRVVGYCI